MMGYIRDVYSVAVMLALCHNVVQFEKRAIQE